jgi:hypothetical protein
VNHLVTCLARRGRSAFTRPAARAVGASLALLAFTGAGLASAVPASAGTIPETCNAVRLGAGPGNQTPIAAIDSCIGENSSNQVFSDGAWTAINQGLGIKQCGFAMNLRDDTMGITIATKTFGCISGEEFSPFAVLATRGHHYHTFIIASFVLTDGETPSYTINSPELVAS